jgi:PAS domain S-box-containing protein
VTLLGTNIYLAATLPAGWGVEDLTRAAVFTGIALLITAFAAARESSEREARRQTAHLEAMFGQASLGISHLTLDGRLTRVNRRMADIIGRPIEATVGLTCEQITHPDDWPSHARLIEQVAAGSLTEIAIDKRYLRPDGTDVWVHVSMAPLLDGSGEPEGLIAIVEDIAERHEAEDRLRASESRYRSLVDATTAIVWSADASGRSPCRRNRGRPLPGRMRGATRASAGPQRSTPRIARTCRRCGRTRWHIRGRWIRRRVSGTPRRCRTVGTAPRSAPLRPDGAVEEWVGACTDIHERRVAEIQLRESEERAHLALDIAQLGTMTWVRDDDDVLADARGREICGLPATGAIRAGRSGSTDPPRAIATTSWPDWPTPPRVRAPVRRGVPLRAPRRSVRWVVARGDVVTRPGNTTVPVTVLLLSLMDVTERRLAEKG